MFEHKVDVLLGLQWGDEGKGKIIDCMATKYNIIARFQGGPNAGHTLEFEGKKFVTHHIPSGIFREGKINLLGNGMVIDPITLKAEIDEIVEKQLLTLDQVKERLLIAENATLLVPSHRSLDYINEMLAGKAKIGSTLRGIGPAYTDRTARVALLMKDIFAGNFDEKYTCLVSKHQSYASKNDLSLDLPKQSFLSMDKQFYEAIDFVKQLNFVNCENYLHEKLREGKKVLAEGAQGVFLDIMYGSYPYVTSSSTTIGGVITGLGIAPQQIGEVYGLLKSYATRVGNGPFPTELFDGVDKLDPLGKQMSDIGCERGATTGRQRRCGWLDLVMLKYACKVNGITQLVISKADVLSQFPFVQVAVAYKVDGEETQTMPSDLSRIEKIMYAKFESWRNCSKEGYDDQFEDYIRFIEKYLQVPIASISVGPDREDIIIMP